MEENLKVFYEDNKFGKRNITILSIIMFCCSIGWSLAMILSFVPLQNGLTQNNFQDNLVGNIFIIIFLIALFISAIFYY